jgi:uncharacterized protein YbjT (DUF2867 family)
VTGAGGFVGSSVLKHLLDRGFSINALVHSRPIDPAGGRVRSIRGDLFDSAALDQAVSGCAAVCHLVGIIAEQPRQGVTFQHMHVDGTRAILDAAARNGVRRYIHMSALGTRPDGVSQYHRTKWAAEQLVRASGLDWTIFRPSLIHGPRAELMAMMAAWSRGKASPFLYMPYFAGGLFGHGRVGKVQPVFVEDVARAFAEATDNPASIGNAYDSVGPDVLTWPALNRACSVAIVGKARATLPMPAWLAHTLAAITPAKLLPFNDDQITMALEDGVGDPGPFTRDFGWPPTGFESSLRSYAAQL